jgi:hypothetical protein
MKLELKFDVDDTVRVKGSEKVSRIKTFKVEGYKLGSEKVPNIYYLIQTGLNNYNEWVREERLEFFDELAANNTFKKDFEIGLLDLLINAYLLDTKNIPLIKKLHNDKNLYM